MKRLGLYVAAAFLFVVPNTASAITSQALMGGNTQIFITSNSAARYISLFSNQNVTWSTGVTSNAGSREIITAAGYFTNFTVYTTRALGAGSYTATVMKNGVAQNLACTITSPATSCTDTRSIRVAVGDQVELRVLGASGPNLIPISTVLDFVPDTANETLIGTTINENQTVFSYDSLINRNAFTATESTTTQSLFDTLGTVSNLQISATTAPGAGTSALYSMRVNQATSTLSCTVSGTGKTCSNTTAFVPIQNANFISMSLAPTGAIAANGLLGLGMKFVPITVGQFFFMGGSGSTNQGTTGTIYMSFSGSAATSTQIDAQMVANQMTITNFMVAQNNTTGASATRTYALEVNGVATSATCSTTGTAATTGRNCTWQGSITVNTGDLINYVDTITGTATNSLVRISTTAYRAPSAYQNKILGGFLRIMGGFIKIR